MLPNKTTPAVSSSLIRWALRVSKRRRHASAEGRRWQPHGSLCNCTSLLFILPPPPLVCRQTSEFGSGGVSRSGEGTVWVRGMWGLTMYCTTSLSFPSIGWRRGAVSRAVMVARVTRSVFETVGFRHVIKKNNNLLIQYCLDFFRWRQIYTRVFTINFKLNYI